MTTNKKKTIGLVLFILLVLGIIGYFGYQYFEIKRQEDIRKVGGQNSLEEIDRGREEISKPKTVDSYLKERGVEEIPIKKIEDFREKKIEVKSSGENYYEYKIFDSYDPKTNLVYFYSNQLLRDLPLFREEKKEIGGTLEVQKVSRKLGKKIEGLKLKTYDVFIGGFEFVSEEEKKKNINKLSDEELLDSSNSWIYNEYQLTDILLPQNSKGKKTESPQEFFGMKEVSLDELKDVIRKSKQPILTLRGMVPYKKLPTDKALELIERIYKNRLKVCNDLILQRENYTYVTDINGWFVLSQLPKKCDTIDYFGYNTNEGERISLIYLNKFFTPEDQKLYYDEYRIPQLESDNNRILLDSLYLKLQKENPEIFW